MTKQERKILIRCTELCSARGYGLAYSLVGKREDAEDVVQEALMTATRKVAELSNRPWPWLASTIVNLARNHRRKQSRRGPTLPLMEDEAREEDTPLEASLRRELRSELVTHFQALPDVQREAIALVYLAGLSRRQAAKEVGRPYPSFRRDLEAALELLRTRMTLPRKTLLSALPVLAVSTPSASFISALGSSASLPATSTGATSLTLNTSIWSLAAMKKYAALVVLLLLIAAGVSGWLIFIDDTPLEKAPAANMESKAQSDEKLDRNSKFSERQTRSVPDEPEPTHAEVIEIVEPAETGIKEEARRSRLEATAVTGGRLHSTAIEKDVMRLEVVDQSGTPISGVLLKPRTHGFETYYLREMRTDLAGVYEFTKERSFDGAVIAEGFTTIYIRLWSSQHRKKNTRVVLARKSDVKRVEILVHDEKGRGVEGVLLAIGKEPERRNSGNNPFYPFVGQSNATGRCVFEMDSRWLTRRLWLEIPYGSMPGLGTANRREVIFERALVDSDFTGTPIKIEYSPAVTIKGRVQQANGKPAPAATVGITSFEPTLNYRSGVWSAQTLTNSEGGFTHGAKIAKQVDVGVSWRNPNNNHLETFYLRKLTPDEKGVIDIGTVTLVRRLHIVIRTFIDGEPYTDGMIFIREDGKAAGLFQGTDGFGEVVNDRFPLNRFSHSTSIEMKVSGELGESPWVSLRPEEIGVKDIRLDAKSVKRGTVEFKSNMPELEPYYLRYTALELDGRLQVSRFGDRMPENWKLTLPVGRYRIRIDSRKYPVFWEQEVNVAADQHSPVLVQLAALAQVTFFHTLERRGVDFSVTCNPIIEGLEIVEKPRLIRAEDVSNLKNRFDEQKKSGRLLYVMEPGIAFTLRVAAYQPAGDGIGKSGKWLDFEKTFELGQGEKREIDITEQLKEVLAKFDD